MCTSTYFRDLRARYFAEIARSARVKTQQAFAGTTRGLLRQVQSRLNNAMMIDIGNLNVNVKWGTHLADSKRCKAIAREHAAVISAIVRDCGYF